jgi:AcrR family transcriptional regulator
LLLTVCDITSQDDDILCDAVSRDLAPPAPRAPRVPAEQARRRIIEAANRLLHNRRFRDLTVEDVMVEAGLARTVFYRYFGGLPEIVLGLLEMLLDQVVAEADAGDPRDRSVLRRQLAIVVQTFREHGPMLLALDEAAHHDDSVERAYRAWIDHTVEVSAELIERGIAQGHTPPMATLEVARALTAMNGNYLLDLIRHDPGFDTEVALEALWTVWMRTTWPETGDGDGVARAQRARRGSGGRRRRI